VKLRLALTPSIPKLVFTHLRALRTVAARLGYGRQSLLSRTLAQVVHLSKFASWQSHSIACVILWLLLNQRRRVQKLHTDKAATDGHPEPFLVAADFEALLATIAISTSRPTLPNDAEWYIIHPAAWPLRAWDWFVRGIAFFFFLEVPFDIGFSCSSRIGHEYELAIHVLESLLLVDIVLTCCRAFYSANGAIVYNAASIRSTYFANRFALDVLASFPLTVILWVYGVLDHPAAPWLRLPRILCMYSVWYKRDALKVHLLCMHCLNLSGSFFGDSQVRHPDSYV
jgi:hypothetical protein